jgi:hypothetical protein
LPPSIAPNNSSLIIIFYFIQLGKLNKKRKRNRNGPGALSPLRREVLWSSLPVEPDAAWHVPASLFARAIKQKPHQ